MQIIYIITRIFTHFTKAAYSLSYQPVACDFFQLVLRSFVHNFAQGTMIVLFLCDKQLVRFRRQRRAITVMRAGDKQDVYE